MICAYCGEDKELCQSCTSDGIKQPRACKDCLISLMNNGYNQEPTYWVKQLKEANDWESIAKLIETNGE